ncbi:carboxypeptidase regulatory-like domain-containing protein [Paracidobacterium acidisoli]|uniref:carboxypeptidase regulatory-like domain-containing protein n=1 Tax=Paracidobacterium acidisoli TaxID=2303751 RepID=UPI0033160B1F
MKYVFSSSARTRQSAVSWTLLPTLVLALLLISLGAHAQLTTGSLSGTVQDQSGAVIPNAQVTLLNDASHDRRQSTSNSAGYFTFAGVQPGSYTITIQAKGFENWSQTGVTMNPGDIRQVPNIQMAVGSAGQTVQVQATASQILPIDSGERSAVLSSQDIQKLSIESRNISELLKILPGVTSVANGTSNGLGFDFSNSGSTGSTIGVGLSANGAPYRGGTSYTLDGANIIDPGCNCWSIAVVNPDMTDEVKVQTSNFGADSPNGPVIVNAISKAGGATFHGQAYLYARNNVLNANTWLNNRQGAARQTAAYYYPGGNIGGPVRIPGTDFNKNDKLLFWGGYEYYSQNLPAVTPLESYVPSAGMRAGNFTSSGDGNGALCPGGFNSTATNTWCDDLTGSYAPDGTKITGGMISQQYLDPGAASIMKMFPTANANPETTPGGFNYFEPINTQHNGYVYRVRVDYNLDQNNKLFVTYQEGDDTNTTPAHLYYNPANAVLYQGGLINNPTTSRVLTGNFLHVFSPTLTNEFVAAWGYVNSPNKPTNLSAAYKSTLGYPYETIFNSASSLAPSINSAGPQTFPDLSQADYWEPNGTYPLRKENPSFSDNITKVYRNHTFKFGAFTELAGNFQGTAANVNGSLYFSGKNGPLPDMNNPKVNIGSYNPVANLVMGIANNGTGGSGFQQASSEPYTDMAYRTTSAYVMDTWQVKPRFTLNLGIRWDHIGRWYDRQGTGLAVWLPGQYSFDLGTGKAYPGISWHAINPGIPVGGSPDNIAFTSPRFGFSYDVQGNGNVVVRGGWGEYRWNDQYNDYAGALNTAQEVSTYNSPVGDAITLSEINALGVSGAGSKLGSLPSSVQAADANDHRMPLTYAWNLTVDKQLPWRSLFEIAYVGNSTHQLLMGGQSGGSDIGGSGFSNMNKIPLGGLFQQDPVTGAAAPANPDNTSSYNIIDYYPYYAGYGSNSITVNEHVGYSNYNGLQLAWLKQVGHLSFNLNYTWSKALGIVNSTVDAFSVHGNYGVLNIDRPQVVNTSYAYAFGDVYHGNRFAGGAINHWTISGITTWQSGGNLQAEYTQNLGMTLNYVDAKGTITGPLTSNSYFGTNAQSILPVLTCNPRSGLASHQLANLSCFSAPQIGQQGVRQISPYLSGPSYTNTDLTVFKTFGITDRQKMEFRASAFNAFNHPLYGFSTNNDITLNYTTPDGHTFTPNLSALQLAQGETWGTEDTKAGNARIMELSLKYSF